jgi:hypothetical protein
VIDFKLADFTPGSFTRVSKKDPGIFADGFANAVNERKKAESWIRFLCWIHARTHSWNKFQKSLHLSKALYIGNYSILWRWSITL